MYMYMYNVLYKQVRPLAACSAVEMYVTIYGQRYRIVTAKVQRLIG